MRVGISTAAKAGVASGAVAGAVAGKTPRVAGVIGAVVGVGIFATADAAAGGKPGVDGAGAEMTSCWGYLVITRSGDRWNNTEVGIEGHRGAIPAAY